MLGSMSTKMYGWVDKWILGCMDGKVDDDGGHMCAQTCLPHSVYNLRESRSTVLWGINEADIAPVPR